MLTEKITKIYIYFVFNRQGACFLVTASCTVQD